jgi:hypothetical protein
LIAGGREIQLWPIDQAVLDNITNLTGFEAHEFTGTIVGSKNTFERNGDRLPTELKKSTENQGDLCPAELKFLRDK